MSSSPNALAGPSSPSGQTVAGGTKEKATRSRSGCLVCRARRIRCDEGEVTHLFRPYIHSLSGRPDCARCIKYGAEVSHSHDLTVESLMMECAYAEKRPFDAEKTKKTLSKRHKISSNSPKPLSSPNTVWKLYDDAPTSMDALMALCRMTKMGSFFSQPSEPPDFLRLAFTDEDELKCVSLMLHP